MVAIDRRRRPRAFTLLDVDHRDAVLAVELEVLLAVHRTADADLDEASARR